MMEVLTPFSQVDRESRKMDPATFVATPGIWGKLASDGSIVNITAGTPGVVTKLVGGSFTGSAYESHDSRVGRITTLESIGIRVKIDTAGYVGTPTMGCLMAVSDQAEALGKLFNMAETPYGESGNYEVVARCEQINSDGTIIIRTLSPKVTATSAIESQSMSPSESASQSPSESASASPSA
jgi:hypothetical protein